MYGDLVVGGWWAGGGELGRICLTSINDNV